MKKILILFVILIAVAIGGTFAQKYVKNNPSTLPFTKQSKAIIKNQSFNLLLAKSGKEKEIGLSEKKSLDENSGMLFTFDKPGYYSFWMKNMKFPIDIIFIKDNKIVTIHENVKPPKTPNESVPIFKPEAESDKVLEINAGLSQKYGFKNGDEIKFEGI